MNPPTDKSDQEIVSLFGSLRPHREAGTPEWNTIIAAAQTASIQPSTTHRKWQLPVAAAAAVALTLTWFAATRSADLDLPSNPSLLKAEHSSEDLIAVPTPLFASSENLSPSLFHSPINITIFP